MENNINKKQRNKNTDMGTKENLELSTTVEDQAQNEEGQVLKGTLGPLVNELKLLHESMDKKYTKLDEKYTKLETAISNQRNLKT